MATLSIMGVVQYLFGEQIAAQTRLELDAMYQWILEQRLIF